MSTPFDVRRWAEQAGIHTTGGFSVVAECVTLDELQRFADIAIATAAKHWQRTHAITAQALEALENAQDQLAKPYSTDASNAITALREALAESDDPVAYDGWVLREVLFDNGEPVGHRAPEQEPVAWMYDCGNGGRMYAEELDGVEGWMPLYTFPPQRKPLEGVIDVHPIGHHSLQLIFRSQSDIAKFKAAHGIKGEA